MQCNASTPVPGAITEEQLVVYGKGIFRLTLMAAVFADDDTIFLQILDVWKKIKNTPDYIIPLFASLVITDSQLLEYTVELLPIINEFSKDTLITVFQKYRHVVKESLDKLRL